MAVEIGALRALLSLDSAAFETGVDRARASMTGLQRTTRSAGVAIAKTGRLIAAGLAVATTAAAAGALSASRNLQELAQQARIAGLSAQEFKVLSLASKEFGIEQDKLSDILKDVNDKFGDYFATGAGPLADFFDNIAPKVGLTAEAFEGLSSSDALQLYVTSLEKANVSQQEMTFYMEALANDATALIPLFRDNGRAIDDMAQRAEALGLALDEKTIDAASRARSEFSVIADVMKTQLGAAFVELMPALAELAEAALPLLVKVLEAAKPVIEGLAALLQGDFKSAWEIARQAAEQAINAIIAVLEGLAVRAVAALKNLASAIIEEIKGIAVQAFEEAKQAGANIINGLVEGILGNRETVGSASRRAARDAAEAARDELDIRSPSRVFRTIGAQIMEGLAIGIEENAGSELFAPFLQAIDSAIQGGNSLRDSFASVLNSMGQQLYSSGLTGLGNLIFGGTGTSLFAGFFDNGGIIPSGMYGVVGERGPELVQGPAVVTSRVDTAAMMGGSRDVNVKVSVDNNGNLQAFVDQRAGLAVAEGSRAASDGFNQRATSFANDRRRRGPQ